MKKLFLILPLAAYLLIGCTPQQVTPPNNDDEQPVEKHQPRKLVLTDAEQQMHKQTNTFAFDMLSRIAGSEESKPNICFSPMSANMALGLLMNGANGNTLTEMQNTLGFKGATEEQINAYYHKLVEALPYLDSTTVVKIANALWLRNDFPVKPAYKQATSDTFEATIDNVGTFTDQTVIDAINQWAADNTNNLITKVLDRNMVNEYTEMIFANALYFKGIWANKFEKSATQKETFTTTAGTMVKAQTMHKLFKHGEVTYGETDEAQVLELPYQGGAYCMDIILPKEDNTPEAILSNMTTDNWHQTLQQLYFASEVDVWLPKFKFEYKRSLVKDLQELGIHDAFTGAADFSRLSDVPTYLGFIMQYCYIAVDEAGTEAAAVTIGGNYTTSVGPEPNPIVFRADHPFVYIIREKQYGTILFCGVLNNPA